MSEQKNHLIHEQSSQEHEVRLSKVHALREQGIEPWPCFKPVKNHAAVIKKECIEKNITESAESYSLAGRVMSKREHGKTIFMDLKDKTGTFQLYCNSGALGEETFKLLQHYIDLGDVIWVSGSLFTTKMGELSLKAQELTLLSKCLHPLPDKFHGMTDVEHRYRQRYLDLMINHETADKFKKRSHILQAIRKFLTDKEFLEVETPMLHPIAGGAAARPFVTHHNAYNTEFFLRIAPELYLKRLVVGGFDRVFEINRNFRNEGVSTRHNPEFTMLELYMAHGDFHDGVAITQALFHDVLAALNLPHKLTFKEHEIDFSTPFAQYTVEEALIHLGGFKASDLTEVHIDRVIKEHNVELAHAKASQGEKLFALFEECVEEKIVNPTFIVGYPLDVSPLAKRDPKNSELAARFELFVAGMELANGFTELNDPLDQAERFKKQVDAKDAGDEEAHNYDADFVHALEYGLPPTVGVGIGIDRLVMLLTNTSSIKDVILFPTLKKVQQ
jgi:lysyl-tRNA synthetase class 2